MKRAPRWEIVRTDAQQPWHARFVAGNGRAVWVTENYARRRDALNAIHLVAVGMAIDDEWRPLWEVREVDERTEGNATNGGAVLVVGSDG